jgi:hypothetical protein
LTHDAHLHVVNQKCHSLRVTNFFESSRYIKTECVFHDVSFLGESQKYKIGSSGLGIAYLPNYRVVEDIRAGRLLGFWQNGQLKYVRSIAKYLVRAIAFVKLHPREMRSPLPSLFSYRVLSCGG